LRYGLFYGPDFYPELNVYDDLKSSGELALLKNSTLRQSLAALDARLELVRAAQDDLTTVQQLTIDPYLVKRLDLLPLLGPLSGIDLTDEGSGVDSRFLSDVEFRNLILFKLDLVMQTEKVFEDADAALIAVEQSMAAEDALGGS
jgi:hypothetical protein